MRLSRNKSTRRTACPFLPQEKTAQKLVEDVPGLSLTLDWAQMVSQDIFHDQIVELIPLARHIQIRQAARAQLQVPFDRGRINIEKVIKALKDADYDGVICAEYMQKKGWHGAIEVDGVTECIQMRDAMRDARNALNTQS